MSKRIKNDNLIFSGIKKCLFILKANLYHFPLKRVFTIFDLKNLFLQFLLLKSYYKNERKTRKFSFVNVYINKRIFREFNLENLENLRKK